MHSQDAIMRYALGGLAKTRSPSENSINSVKPPCAYHETSPCPPISRSPVLLVRYLIDLLSLALLIILFSAPATAQTGGGHMLYGDFKVDESKVTGPKPLSFDLILYTSGGRIVARQTVGNNSHYRFMDVSNGDYEVAVEVEGNEVVRIHVLLNEIFKTDIRQDISLGWHEQPIGERSKSGTASAADLYKRTPRNKKRFEQAQESINKKRYEEGVAQLQEVLADDPADYQCWTELGTAYLIQNNLAESEKAYLRAVEIRPDYLQALMNLGRLRLLSKNLDGAVETLSKAVALEPASADANYYLGEAYLQLKKGSKAVGYLYEALKLDPVGKAEAHLRLAALYNGAGLKEKAAAEYEEFLKKKPDYPDKKKLEQYIAANRKVSSKQ